MNICLFRFPPSGICSCSTATNTNANGHANGNGHDADHDHHHHHHHQSQQQQQYETDSIDGGDAGHYPFHHPTGHNPDEAEPLADKMQRMELHSARGGSAGGGGGGVEDHAPPLEVKFADQPETLSYEDIPEPGPDPDPYDFHPHHLELEQPHEDGAGGNREHSLSPQSVSQQATPEHPSAAGIGGMVIGSGGGRKPVRYSKQHTGLKNISFGVGAAVMPSGKMEFEQEQNEGFGSVKINRPIGNAAGGGRHTDDNESVYSRDSSGGSGQHGGSHFDLKFYHNKLW